MPKLRTETFGPGDQSWLGSTHGIRNARSVAIDKSSFTAGTHYPNGYLPAGTPLALNTSTNKYALYVSGGTNGTAILAGFLFTDQPVTADATIDGPLFDHGRIRTSRLPFAFTVPAAANVSGQFVFV